MSPTTRARKIRVGLFAAGALALAALVLIVFGGMRFWADRDTYHVVIDDGVMGLEPGADVLHNGVRVGSVEGLATSREDLRAVRVTIGIDDGVPVKTDTRAVLRFVGITGLKVVDLIGGTVDAPDLPPGSEIARGETMLDEAARRAMEVMRQSDELARRANEVLARTEQVLANVAEVTDPAQFAGIAEIVDHARATTAQLATTSATIDAIVGENRAALHASMTSLADATARVDQVVASIDAVVADVAGVVATNETQLRSAVNDVRQATRSFRDLARDLKARPSRLLFGKPPRERELP